MDGADTIADALARIADALERVARAIDRLGNADATTPFGGLEALGMSTVEAANIIATAIEERR